MRKYSLLFKVATIGLALALTNCSPEESQRKRSFVDGSFEDFSQEEGVTPQESVEAAKLDSLIQQIEPLVVEQLSEEAGNIDGPMLLQKVIIPLREITLNRDYLLDPEHMFAKAESGIPLMPRLITLFNQAIILAHQSNPVLITGTDILQKYKDLIFWDCNYELKGSCELIKFYRAADSNNITKILKLIHDLENDEDEKLRIVKAGFDLKNRRIDAPLRFMLLERIVKSFKEEKTGAISKERLSQDADLFANIFKINNFSGDTSEMYTQLIREINPWLLSRNVDNAKNPAMTDLIRLGGASLIYEGNRVSPELKTVINGLDYKIGPQFEQGVEFQKDNINGLFKKGEFDQSNKDLVELVNDAQAEGYNGEVSLFGEESAKIYSNLLSDVSFEKDEYYFLVHQLYYGHYNIDDAAAFWKQTKKDEGRLMTATMNLMKLQIVNSIVMTNTRMNEFYNENKNTKLLELLQESDKEGSRIRKVWTKLIVRTKQMKSFVNRVVTKTTSKEVAQDKEGSPKKSNQLDTINRSVDALTKNIKFLVTYPNMFPLLHLMASLEMKDEVQTPFGPLQIDNQTVIEFFFAGRFVPFFNFGNDGNPLDSTEVIYAFYYALATEIFKTYSVNEVVQFSSEDFFKVVVKRLILKSEKELDDSRRWLQETRNEYMNSVNAMKMACKEEKAKQQKEGIILDKKIAAGNFTIDDLHATMQPRSFANNQLAFAELGSSVYDQTSNDTEKIGKYLHEVYSQKVSGVYKKMRSGFQVQNVLAKTLLDVYKSYNKESIGEIDKIFKEQFAEYGRLKAEYNRLFFEINEEIDGCEWTFIKRDRDIRHSLIFQEVRNLESLFDEMEQALGSLNEEQRASLSQEKTEEVEEIRRKYMAPTQDPMFPNEYRERLGYTTITPTRVTSYKMDVYARLMSYLVHDLYPGQYKISPPSSFQNEVVYKEAGPSFIYFDWNDSNRERAKQKFVQSGIKTFAHFVKWAGEAPGIEMVEGKGEILVDLYKLNTVSINPDVDCAEHPTESEVYMENCKKIQADDLISYYKEIINLSNIDARDEIVLDLLGKESKYPETTYDRLIKKQNKQELYSYYDLIFKRIMSDGGVLAPEETWFKSELVKYLDSVHKRRDSTFIFPYPEEIEQIYIRNYKAWLDDYFAANVGFIREVKKQIDAGVEPFQFKYRMDRSHTLGGPGTGSLDPLVSSLTYGKFVGFSQQVDNDTSRYFSEIIRAHRNEIDQIVEGTE